MPKRHRNTDPGREAAIRAEEERAIIREACSALGRRSTPAKRRAARANGRKGGRPAKRKDADR